MLPLMPMLTLLPFIYFAAIADGHFLRRHDAYFRYDFDADFFFFFFFFFFFRLMRFRCRFSIRCLRCRHIFAMMPRLITFRRLFTRLFLRLIRQRRDAAYFALSSMMLRRHATRRADIAACFRLCRHFFFDIRSAHRFTPAPDAAAAGADIFFADDAAADAASFFARYAFITPSYSHAAADIDMKQNTLYAMITFRLMSHLLTYFALEVLFSHCLYCHAYAAWLYAYFMFICSMLLTR